MVGVITHEEANVGSQCFLTIITGHVPSFFLHACNAVSSFQFAHKCVFHGFVCKGVFGVLCYVCSDWICGIWLCVAFCCDIEEGFVPFLVGVVLSRHMVTVKALSAEDSSLM